MPTVFRRVPAPAVDLSVLVVAHPGVHVDHRGASDINDGERRNTIITLGIGERGVAVDLGDVPRAVSGHDRLTNAG